MGIIGDMNKKRILDVGCGFGRESILLAKNGALVTGIDISHKSIQVAKKLALDEGIDNIDFKVLKVEDLTYENEFDVVFCRGSLHHFYDVESVVKTLYKALKKDGLMIAQEPKTENPIAIIGRKFFNPSTPTEHPFQTGELKNIFNEVFGNVHTEYFNLISPLSLTFGQIKFLDSKMMKTISFKILDPLDKLLLSFNSMKKYSWLEVVWSTRTE